MVLNIHERWLLHMVGLRRAERGAMIAELIKDGHAGGDVDLTAQMAGYNLAKRSVRADLERMFDRLMNPSEPSVRKVVYGHRRYRAAVILAAALRQAGLTIDGYRHGSVEGCRTLAQFQRAPR